MADLFKPIVPAERLHPSFKALAGSPGFAAGRDQMNEIFADFSDVDGNFVQQFQTDGFDARTFELYLFAVFCDLHFEVLRFNTPDFCLKKGGYELSIEAVTTNPSQNGFSASVDPSAELTQAQIDELQGQFIPIKYGSALTSKLGKKYWELPQVTGRPFILAIEPFHDDRALFFADASLTGYLFGISQTTSLDAAGNLSIKSHKLSEHRFGAKVIPSGFFNLPGAENISAVLFSNSGTTAKFNRIGDQGKFHRSNVVIERVGNCYNSAPNATKPLNFSYVVGAKNAPTEKWADGISLIHNPAARYPVDPALFPAFAHERFDGNQVRSRVPKFHIYASRTFVHISKDDWGLDHLRRR